MVPGHQHQAAAGQGIRNQPGVRLLYHVPRSRDDQGGHVQSPQILRRDVGIVDHEAQQLRVPPGLWAPAGEEGGEHRAHNELSLAAALPYLIGGAAGGLAGALSFQKVPVKWLKLLFAGFLLYGGVRYLL